MTTRLFRTIGSIASIVASMRESRSRKRMVQQFQQQGFVLVTPPAVPDLLPLRRPELVRAGSVFLFEKADTQVLVFSTVLTPRSRVPYRGRGFVLMVLPLGEEADLHAISAAIREPAEVFSVVDQLELDSYPSLSPLPDGTIFAADEQSARRILPILQQHRDLKSRGSLVVHHGRILFQLAL